MFFSLLKSTFDVFQIHWILFKTQEFVVINSFVGSFKLAISSKYPNYNHDKDILVDNTPLKFYQGMKMFMAFQHHRIQRLPIIS
jgi:hypothetical protein